MITSALLASCAGSTPRTEPEIPGVYAFRAVGRSAQGAVIEELAGTAHVSGDELRIVVTGGYASLANTQTRRTRGLSAGLAYRRTSGQFAGQWDFRQETPVVPVTALTMRGDTLAAPVEFVLRGVASLNLRDHWIVIQQHHLRFNAQEREWRQATRPVNSQRDVFGR